MGGVVKGHGHGGTLGCEVTRGVAVVEGTRGGVWGRLGGAEGHEVTREGCGGCHTASSPRDTFLGAGFSGSAIAPEGGVVAPDAPGSPPGCLGVPVSRPPPRHDTPPGVSPTWL